MKAQVKVPSVEVEQHGKSFFLTKLTAEELVQISYVARRGYDDEVGAVQRLLNPSRIASIRDFVLAGGLFPTSIVLNWSDTKKGIKPRSGGIVIPLTPRSAQIIDGQHRVVGLAAAIDKRKSLAGLSVPVSLYRGLSTQECADIFLAINTEQKPVHKSLVFDLYRLASDYVVDQATLRAGDLAKELNDNTASPYREFIKFPGSLAGSKGLALSTIVSAFKPLVEGKAVFEQVGLTELQMQTQFLMNFFIVLKDAYGNEWESSGNVFRSAAGFIGAIEFIKNKLIVHCNIHGDFTVEAIRKVMKLSTESLIRRDSISGLQGRRAFAKVAEALETAFDPSEGKSRKIKV